MQHDGSGSKVNPSQDHQGDPRDPDLAPPAVGSGSPGQVPVNAGAGAGQRAAARSAPARRTKLRPAGRGWLGRRRVVTGVSRMQVAAARVIAAEPDTDLPRRSPAGKVFRRGDRDAPGHVAGKTRAPARPGCRVRARDVRPERLTRRARQHRLPQTGPCPVRGRFGYLRSAGRRVTPQLRPEGRYGWLSLVRRNDRRARCEGRWFLLPWPSSSAASPART